MPPKKKRKAKFLKKDTDSMVLELKKQEEGEKSCEEIVEAVVSKLQTGTDLKYKEARKRFVDVLCSVKVKEELCNTVRAMVSNYLHLLKQHSKGKRFCLFEQAWLMHIEDYFTETTPVVNPKSCYGVWKSVIEKCDCDCSIEEQRIIVSTVAYIIYDIMTGKVKEHKSQLSSPIETNEAHDCEPAVSIVESNVCLYRYGGFALHSLLQKYEKAAEGCNDSCDHDMMPVLRQLTIKHDQASLVPYGIQQLNQGGLVIMDPFMLPYLRTLIEKVSSLVNEDQSREFGQHMIEIARSKIETDSDLNETFIRCIKNAGVDPSNPIIPKVYKELSRKMFHARVNEYMTAAVEIDLERSGKAVKADQSLRDQLKTYSAMKTR